MNRITPLAVFLALLTACSDAPDPAQTATQPATAVNPPAAPMAAAPEFPDVPRLNASAMTVIGISAGGYMAQQLHLAHASRIVGLGLIASGPWGCADGNLRTAMARCLGNPGDGIDTAALAQQAADLAAAGQIEKLDHLADARLWVLHGTADAVIARSVAEAIPDLYRNWLADEAIAFVGDVAAAHGFPTLDKGSECAVSTAPFLADCDFDTAGEALEFLLGPLQPPVSAPQGQLLELPVEQPLRAGLFETAYLYLPDVCQEGAPCDLHLVLHGCAQSAETLGTAFIEGAGFQRWADANRLAILFPQVTASAANPYACWDWWGYSGAGYQTREGLQIVAIMTMADRLASP